MVTVSTRVHEFDRIHAIAAAHEPVYCSLGTHPHNAAEETDVTAEHLVRMADRPKVVALGESGLDFHYDHSPRDDQRKGFRTHIEAARRTGLPLIIHTRSADEETADILAEEMEKGAFKALLHCFSSGRELALRGVELGLYVSFSGILTFKKSEELREIAKEIPADRLLVETDAPFLAPTPHRGKRNEPAFVRHTAQVLAETRGVGLEEIAALTTANFFRLFVRVPPP
jgi:TatD DNase family protein